MPDMPRAMPSMIALSIVALTVGCGERKPEPDFKDTAAMAPAPADTGMGMSHDSMPMSSDSTMARDTTANGGMDPVPVRKKPRASDTVAQARDSSGQSN